MMTLVMLISFAACDKKGEDNSSSSEPDPTPDISSGSIFINPLKEFSGNGDFPSYISQIAEKFDQNADTVGWLHIPGTHIDDVIVCNDDPNDKNAFYYRRNFKKEYSFNGIFYADFRNKFGNGTAEDLSPNTVIYGHTMDENAEGVMFGPLRKFLEEDFAKDTPYVYFSTANEDLVWEVFSVFYGTIKLPYNTPDLQGAQFDEIVGECVKRSIYTYDTQVSSSDKILTLSTCCYSVPGIGPVAYPSDYRYVIMAKLVQPEEATKTEASFTVNPSPKAP